MVETAMKTFGRALVAVIVLLAAAAPAFSAAALDGRGYNIYAQAGDVIPDAVLADLKAQIDICEKAPVPPGVKAFFKAVPVTLVISKTRPAPTSRYGGISKEDRYGQVTLQSAQIERANAQNARPILLHEYLHGVHAKLLPDGMHNEEIQEYYQRAKERLGKFERGQGEYFLKDKGEFFAVTASIYLFGDIPRAPYSMKNISENMPRYAAYLKRLFTLDLADTGDDGSPGASK